MGLTLQQVLDSEKRMGHAFVLAMLLEHHPAVEQYLTT